MHACMDKGRNGHYVDACMHACTERRLDHVVLSHLGTRYAWKEPFDLFSYTQDEECL